MGDPMSELLVLVDGEPAARVVQAHSGDLSLVYDRSWQDRPDSFAISLSMPLSRLEHGDAAVRPFMEGLLPDSADILAQWGRRFQVSPRNPFALLAHMGEDCAGAVQFVRPDRFPVVARPEGRDVEWLSDDDIAERLRNLVEQHGVGRMPGDRGQFSLAGAQPKMPLLFDGGRWGIPSGAKPTTHILKPSAQRDLDGFELNEHFCLRLASALDLAAADSSLGQFGDGTALVVTRYDRARTHDGTVLRLHQEDICQALAVSPLRKYQNEGGPGPEDVVALLLRESSEPQLDVAAFVDALALNWAIGGTDAHAKNFSLLLSAGTVRLAPLYDLVSILPYQRHLHYRTAKLAMRVDREYHLWKIERRHWEGLAARCDLDPEPVVERVGQLLAAIPEAVDRVMEELVGEGAAGVALDGIASEIRAHGERCLRMLDR
ncbi:type II toxin-antitoxin system HipA family toxin [Gaopeijia maritima]|uniref:type II toxin-antitoxin system HipA family toxin n=1 Tax=Gaopeijia maritima TaxID=3119007 RepID=UPI0032465AC4